MEYVIRPIGPQDAEGFNALRRMPGVFENTLGLPSERIQWNMDGINRLTPSDHNFVAVTPEGLVIGAVGLQVRSNPRTRHVGSVGIFVHAAYQGRGLGTALLNTVLDLADRWLMLERVELEVFSTNQRAKALYQRLGFEVEGLRRRAVIQNGVYVDEYLMARLRTPGEEP